MENWNSKPTVQKGNFGEEIVRRHLEKFGWIVYEPKTAGAHAFDKLCVRDKKEVCIVEVKSKARMTKYNATGFNTRHLNEYKFIQDKYGIDVFCFFVDEGLGKIYGQSLSNLMQEYKAEDGTYPKIIGSVTVFSLEVMKDIAILTDDEIRFLKDSSTRNYEYAQ